MCNPLKKLKPPPPKKNVNIRKNSTNPTPPLHESILTTTATSKSHSLPKDFTCSRNNLNLTLPKKI